MGLILATGGKQATAGSLMCKNGVNLKLIREDNTDQMQALMATFAEGLKKGEKNPAAGAHFVAIMGDGSAMFLKGLNDRLRKLGPDYTAVIVGSAGYSRGEDKFMGPAAWKQTPAKARGGLVAGVLRDGDWNIALKWLGDNKLANNPDETSYDPEALNWVAASDYIDAAQKYVSGFCTELKNTKTGKKEKHCVDGVVTWTPGDVTVAEKKGGLVSIVSTKENRMQMPNVIIGNKKWMAANRDIVKGMLAAIVRGRRSDREGAGRAASKAAELSAVVYGEKDADYWQKYFKPSVQKDKQGHERRARRLDRQRPGRERPAVRPRRQDQLLRRDVHDVRGHREVAVPEAAARLRPRRGRGRRVIPQGSARRRRPRSKKEPWQPG